jgi:Zn-dependent protease with chaperone function
MPKDKLKASYSKEELEAYLLHERGHFDIIGRMMTGVYALLLAFIVLFAYLVVFFTDRKQYILSCKIIGIIFVFLFLGWLLNMVREYYADNYSWRHCNKKSLISALIKIDKYKRRTIYQSIMRNYTHPSLNSRIALINASPSFAKK